MHQIIRRNPKDVFVKALGPTIQNRYILTIAEFWRWPGYE